MKKIALLGFLVLISQFGFAQDGASTYSSTCAACHQANGQGLPPAFPALKGNEMVNGPAEAAIKALLEGRPGTSMVSFAHLSDTDLAAVLTYIRTSWDNSGGEVTPEEVSALR